MAFIDVIKYESNSDEFVWKHPVEDLKLGSQLIVNTSQKAFFIKGGQIFDEFDSGTTTLKTGNIPLLNKLINLPFGDDSPFQAEVWFVNMMSFLDNKWGTPAPILLEDPKYKVIVPVRAFGQFGLSIEDPRKFLELLVGNMTGFSIDKVMDYFEGVVISSITSGIGKKIVLDGLSILEIQAVVSDVSLFCHKLIQEEFEKYGIKIENFFIMSINVPEDDPSVLKLKEAKDLAAKVNITGKDIYQMDRSFDVMDKAAENEGTMGGTMGAGMGMGMGFGMGNVMGNMTGNMNTGNQNKADSSGNTSPPPPPPTNAQYFVLLENKQNGPHHLNAIQDMINKNMINRQTLVWKEGMSEWGNIMDQNDLKEMFDKIPPPPPSNS
ncbi:MAG: SPFH domain-containing protein [Crocinitomicaceae bacterium]|nr:SPFH domain-containing protein [Crocinitomicaceae bacterium]